MRTGKFENVLALLAALVVGMICGAAQGLTISKLRVPAFVVTLGGFFVFRGLTLGVSESGPVSGFDADFKWWGQARVDLMIVDNVPVPAIIFIGTAIIAAIVLRYSRYGQHVYATGGNREAAKLNGINTDRIENYPGYEAISGPGLIEKMVNQVASFGAEMKMGAEVPSLNRRDDGIIEVVCDDETFLAKSVVLSPGSSYRKLGVPGEDGPGVVGAVVRDPTHDGVDVVRLGRVARNKCVE